MERYKKLLGKNFAVGPVEMEDEVLNIGRLNLPYFRTKEFSEIGKENERIIKKLVNGEEKGRAIFLTSSGTGAMEGTIINSFKKGDKVLVVNGGGFGERFKEICTIHDLEVIELKLEIGENITRERLDKFLDIELDGFIINVHETSTGVLYDMDVVSEFCSKKNVFLVVDAISSFLADEYDMKKHKIDVTIIGSQKGLALPPGLAIIVFSERAVNKIKENKVKSLYFDFKLYLKDGERGQTPFTPAVGILLQLNYKLIEIENKGIEKYIESSKILAEYFRSKIENYPFKIANKTMSNALTPLYVTGNMRANYLFEYLKDNYNIYLCPNGGELGERLIRVGHIGKLTRGDIDELFKVFDEMMEEGIL